MKMVPTLWPWAVKAGISMIGLAMGMTAFARVPGVKAMPSSTTMTNQSPLYEMRSDSSGVTVWLSSVAPTIYGIDAEDLDFYIGPSTVTTGAIEAISAFAAAYGKEDDDTVLVTFLNASMGGSMTWDQASDMEWKCNELVGGMASAIPACDNVDIVKHEWTSA